MAVISDDLKKLVRKEFGDASVTNNLDSVRTALRARCKADLWSFAYYACGFRDCKTPLHMDMCERWMKRSKRRFSLWLIPRSHLKTSLWTIAGSLWELANNPDQRILIVSARIDNSCDILREITAIIETNEIFRWLFPELCYDLAPKDIMKRCRINTTRLDIPYSKYSGRKEGNVEVMSVGTNLTSRHYDLLIFDDPVNEDNVTTVEFRDKMWKWYRNSLQLRDNPLTSRIRLIGTRWHYDDLYARILEREQKRRKKFLEEGKRPVPVYLYYKRRAIENGVPIWPERFTLEELNRLRTEELGSYIYGCQYDNEPAPEEDAYFKRKHIRIISDLEIPDDVISFAAVDLADEETTKGDFTVISVASFDPGGKMYMREVIRERGQSLLSTVDKINNLVYKWKLQRVGVETTGFQKAIYRVYQQMAIDKGWNIPWVEIERGGTKWFKRVLGLTPRVERGDFYIESGIPNEEVIIDELTTFPVGAHDDVLDTIVDLENIFYKAPKAPVEKRVLGTYDDVYGSLFDDALYSEGRLESLDIGVEDEEAYLATY